MKKVILFFCDLWGTYRDKQLPTNEESLKFIQKLQLIRKTKDVDEIIFSFVSTDEKEAVSEAISHFENMIELYEELTNAKTHIISGNHYYDKGSIDRRTNESMEHNFLAKQQVIAKEVNKYFPENQVHSVYFADDSVLNQKIAHHILSTQFSFPIYHIIPSNNKDVIDENILVSSKPALAGICVCLHQQIDNVKAENDFSLQHSQENELNK